MTEFPTKSHYFNLEIKKNNKKTNFLLYIDLLIKEMNEVWLRGKSRLSGISHCS